MWQIRRSKLIEGLNILNLVPEKLGISSSSYVKITGKKNRITMAVSSYIGAEIELEGEGTWPLEDTIYVDRRMFFPWVFIAKELKDKHMFQFENHKKQLLVRHGNRKIALDSQHKVSGYSDTKKLLKGKHSSIPISEDLAALLSCGRNCAVPDSIVPNIDCVYITKSKTGLAAEVLASADKVYYLGIGDIGKSKISSSIPFPLFLVGLLQTEGLRKIVWVGKNIILKFDHGMIWQPISEEALTKFPHKKIRGHADKSEKLPITFTASSRRFSSILVRIGYYLQSVTRRDWVVTLTGKKHGKDILVTTTMPGVHFAEKIQTSEVIPKNFKIEWPLQILEPVFAFLRRKTKKLGVIVRIDEKHGASYVKTGNFWIAVSIKRTA